MVASSVCLEGDCLQLLPGLPEGSIDLTVTSPPYDNLRTYAGSLEWGEHIWKPVIVELYRLTKKGGVVVWVVGDATIKGSETGTSFRQALWAMECGFNLHDTMIFQKASPPTVKSTKRYQTNFEYMFVWVKCSIGVFNPIRVPKRYPEKRTVKVGQRKPDGSHANVTLESTVDKIKENVWHYATSGGNLTKDKIDHPAMFPERLAEDHILSWSNEGDMVLDPFMGSGTVGKMAKLLGRHFIGIEKVPEYCQAARIRIEGA